MTDTNRGKKPVYKRVWFWVLVAIIVVAITPGDEEKPSPSPKESTKQATTEPKENEKKDVTNVGIGKPLKVGDITFTVHGRDTATTIGSDFLKQEAQGKYLILDVSVKNGGKESITMSSSFFNLSVSDSEYEADGVADMYVNDNNTSFLAQKINPGNQVRGKVVFDVNDDVINAKDTLLNVQTGYWGTEQGTIKVAK